jgi:hypothetical protein
MNILLTLDGVLSSESGEPIRAGVILYYALNNAHRVTIMTNRKEDDAKQWLQNHGIINYDDLVDCSCALEGEELKKRQFLLTRSKAPLEMFVDADPSMCAWAFETQNVTALLFSHPGYVRVENRPDAPSKVRKWSDIEESVNRVNNAKAKEFARPKEQDFWAEPGV